jgi:hypothetical protein
MHRLPGLVYCRPLDLSALFNAQADLYLAYDNIGFMMAADLTITHGGLGDLVRALHRQGCCHSKHSTAYYSYGLCCVTWRERVA